MLSVLFLTVFTQATVTDLFKSTGDLNAAGMVLVPKEPKRFEFSEIQFDLGGTWSNALDPNQIDVSANITSPNESYAILNGFLNQDFSVVSQNGVQKLVPIGNPKWLIRFAPWESGSFAAHFQFADVKSKIAPAPLKFKVQKNDYQSFATGGSSYPYLKFGKEFLFCVGKNLSPFEQSTPDASKTAIQATGDIPVIRIALTRGQFDNYFVQPDEFAYRPDMSMLRSAWMIDDFIKQAQNNQKKLILGVGDESDLTSNKNWNSSVYNSKNGGPCQKPDEFFTSLKARVMFKRSLRYWIARIQAYPNIVGIELFPGMDVPGYWLQEMEAEIVGLHIYGLPVSTLPTNIDSAKIKTRGYVSQMVEKSPNPIVLVNQCIEKVREMRKVCDYPVMLISNEETGEFSDVAALISGATGIVSKQLAQNRGIETIFKKFDWSKRKLLLNSVESNELVTSYSRNDDKGGFLIIFAKGASAGTGNVKINLPKVGRYKVEWIDLKSGSVAHTAETKSEGNQVSFDYSGEEKCLAAVFSRL